MISGSVNARREAVVRLRVRGPRGVETHVDALIDTGFDDELTLPASTIKTLGLLWWSQSQAHFADGSGRWFDIDSAEVEWDGAWRPIRISAIGDEVLLGMGMLLQHELRVRVVPGGAVEIDRTP